VASVVCDAQTVEHAILRIGSRKNTDGDAYPQCCQDFEDSSRDADLRGVIFWRPLLGLAIEER
jgi:hypothetical protein